MRSDVRLTVRLLVFAFVAVHAIGCTGFATPAFVLKENGKIHGGMMILDGEPVLFLVGSNDTTTFMKPGVVLLKGPGTTHVKMTIGDQLGTRMSLGSTDVNYFIFATDEGLKVVVQEKDREAVHGFSLDPDGRITTLAAEDAERILDLDREFLDDLNSDVKMLLRRATSGP